MKILLNIYAILGIIISTLLLLSCIILPFKMGFQGFLIAIPTAAVGVFGLYSAMQLKNHKDIGWIVFQAVFTFMTSISFVNIFYTSIFQNYELFKTNAINLLFLIPINISFFLIKKSFFSEMTKLKYIVSHTIGAILGIAIFSISHLFLR